MKITKESRVNYGTVGFVGTFGLSSFKLMVAGPSLLRNGSALLGIPASIPQLAIEDVTDLSTTNDAVEEELGLALIGFNGDKSTGVVEGTTRKSEEIVDIQHALPETARMVSKERHKRRKCLN